MDRDETRREIRKQQFAARRSWDPPGVEALNERLATALRKIRGDTDTIKRQAQLIESGHPRATRRLSRESNRGLTPAAGMLCSDGGRGSRGPTVHWRAHAPVRELGPNHDRLLSLMARRSPRPRREIEIWPCGSSRPWHRGCLQLLKRLRHRTTRRESSGLVLHLLGQTERIASR